ncbi:MAG TPA: hypothetical protein DCD96_04025, partial [Flavobacteriales bacterium]|nr:hypothetical protein [Flavobacteriales bacterium]
MKIVSTYHHQSTGSNLSVVRRCSPITIYFSLFTFFILSFNSVKANYLLLPMDNVQKNHLKSYGIAYWVLLGNVELEWLLNYRGGSFLIPFYKTIQEECVIRGVSYEVITDARAQSIRLEIG